MTYRTQDEIANNRVLMARVAQAATQEQVGVLDTDRWAYEHRRVWASAPGWDAAWEYAKNVHGGEEGYDPGSDEAVITDGMILAQVQLMVPEGGPPLP